MAEVYKAAFVADLVRLGIPPSSGAEAVNELWKQWGGKETVGERRLYAILVPSDAKWTVLMAWQGPSGGPFHKVGRSSGEIELPTQGSAIVPISNVLDRVNKAVTGLPGWGSNKKMRLD
jgi:hypothetical protein